MWQRQLMKVVFQRRYYFTVLRRNLNFSISFFLSDSPTEIAAFASFMPLVEINL